MSKLIDKLNQISKISPQPIGFMRAPPAAPKPRLVLIAELAETGGANLTDCISGADAGLLHTSAGEPLIKALREANQLAADIPWGGWLKDSPEDIGKIVEAGADFMVFPADLPLASFYDDKLEKIPQVGADLDGGLLAALNDLPVNAVLVNRGRGNPLTWHDLLLLRRAAGLVHKFLLVPVPPNITADELKALWGSGVDGVVVPGVPAGTAKALRQLIDGISFPLPRRKVRREAYVPSPIRELVPEKEEDEEEEEEE